MSALKGTAILQPGGFKSSHSTHLITRATLYKLAREHCLCLAFERSGAMMVTQPDADGAKLARSNETEALALYAPRLEAFSRACNRRGYYPSIALAHTVDGVSQPGYPRISVHPQVMARGAEGL